MTLTIQGHTYKPGLIEFHETNLTNIEHSVVTETWHATFGSNVTTTYNADVTVGRSVSTCKHNIYSFQQ